MKNSGASPLRGDRAIRYNSRRYAPQIPLLSLARVKAALSTKRGSHKPPRKGLKRYPFLSGLPDGKDTSGKPGRRKAMRPFLL